MIDYDNIKIMFEELFKLHPNIVRRNSYATTAEYAAFSEGFYRGSNQLFTLERLRDLVRPCVNVSYPDRL